jgi:hypothetical protein
MFGNGVKNGIRKKHRTEVKNGDKKDGRLGGKVQLSRFGWDARPLGIVPRWKVGICGTESTGEKDETASGKEKAGIGRTGIFGILRG